MYDIIIWPGWLAGAGIGLLMVAFYWITGKQLGVSRGYCNIWSYLSRLPFFQQKEYTGNVWRVWFIIGIVLGGFIATVVAHPGQWNISLDMGQAYDAILPSNLWLKMLVLFSGGVVMGLGSRFAGGCTSGHVIAGVPMLNLSSLLAGILFFIGGLVTVQLAVRLVAL
ncbi:YeeE/YedE family protein [Sulfuriferula thiophila]|uniref:YeeE/YedE family protein n=1 Tax=Sulfuriferula thiophila TaxID=1781211 RepID=UPI000F6139E3|nr:YeeE/YedE thiosulfate transporter family protein [Sulfuriferula thiophila]